MRLWQQSVCSSCTTRTQHSNTRHIFRLLFWILLCRCSQEVNLLLLHNINNKKLKKQWSQKKGHEKVGFDFWMDDVRKRLGVSFNWDTTYCTPPHVPTSPLSTRSPLPKLFLSLCQINEILWSSKYNRTCI